MILFVIIICLGPLVHGDAIKKLEDLLELGKSHIFTKFQ